MKGNGDFPVADDQPTGVLVGTVDPVSFEVTHNVISRDHLGTWMTGPMTVNGARHNAFVDVTVPVPTGN
ncbi:MAG: hypothetical protein ACM3JP_01445 [Betaproteobacteria bacterium]